MLLCRTGGRPASVTHRGAPAAGGAGKGPVSALNSHPDHPDQCAISQILLLAHALCPQSACLHVVPNCPYSALAVCVSLQDVLRGWRYWCKILLAASGAKCHAILGPWRFLSVCLVSGTWSSGVQSSDKNATSDLQWQNLAHGHRQTGVAQ